MRSSPVAPLIAWVARSSRRSSGCTTWPTSAPTISQSASRCSSRRIPGRSSSSAARAPWEIDLAEQSVILCALSAKRLAQLKEEASLAADLLEARHEQTIKGLLDLGSRGAALVKAFTRSDAAEVVADAVRGRSGAVLEGLPEGMTARVISNEEVVRIANALDAQSETLVKDRCAAAGAALGEPKLGHGYKAMRELYRKAATSGESMLVAFE